MVILVSLIGYILLISDLAEGRWIEEETRWVDNSQRRMDLSSEDLEDIRSEMINIARLKAISASLPTGQTTGQSVPDLLGDMLCSACSLLEDEAKRQKCQARYCSSTYPSQTVSQTTLGGRYNNRGNNRNASDFFIGMLSRMARLNNFRSRRMNTRNRY